MDNDVRKQIRERIAALLTAAFGLVAALAWWQLWLGMELSGPFSLGFLELLRLLWAC